MNGELRSAGDRCKVSRFALVERLLCDGVMRTIAYFEERQRYA